MRDKQKNSIFKNDKEEHKIVSYFILRKLAKILPLKLARQLTKSLMNSKELLDRTGLGNPEEKDKKANELGIKEANEDIINKKSYRYKVTAKRVIDDFLIYLRLKKPSNN
jgi:hypothetical protein